MKTKGLSPQSRDKIIKILQTMEEYENRLQYNKLDQLYPETGPLSRHSYQKHIDFFNAGSLYKERAVVGANQSGKSNLCNFETAVHATGNYPDWWEGRKFSGSIKIWCIGKTNPLVRDIAQTYLLGELFDIGSGFLPKESIIGRPTSKPGVPNAIAEVRVKRKDGGIATISFLSAEQGREAFQGTKIHFISVDEECALNLYSECLTRTINTGGSMITAFTPLNGITDLVLSFLPNGKFPENGEVLGKSRFVINLTWDDAHHMSESEKEILLATYLPHEIEARTKGIPSIGSGKIYPILEDSVVVNPFLVPPHWSMMFGMDVGWEITSAIWGAKDPNTGVIYLYDEYYGSKQLPVVHVEAIKKRGPWIYGAIDPASDKGSQRDGMTLLKEYIDLGLRLKTADNSLEAGINRVLNLLATGQLKVMNNCTNWLEEYRLYHRNERGDIVRKRNHLMDSTRYLAMTPQLFRVKPDPISKKEQLIKSYIRNSTRDPITGY